MKIIVTESQFKVIEGIIDEAKSKLTQGQMARLGIYLNYFVDKIRVNSTLSLSLASGNSIKLKCISDDNYVFVFNVISDEANILKKRDRVVLPIKVGNGDDDNPVNDYLINKNIITTNNDNSFDLLVTASKKSGVNGSLTISKIVDVFVSSGYDKEEKNTEPEDVPNTEPEDVPNTKPTSGETETVHDGRLALDIIMKDQNLKNAFYAAPNLFKLFMAELQHKQAEGDGIVTVLKLVNDYEKKKLTTNLGGKFIEGKNVSLKPISNFYVPYNNDGKKEKYKFETIIDYEGVVLEKKLGDNYTIMGSIKNNNRLKFILEILKPNSSYDNTFTCVVFILVNNKKVRYPNKMEFQIELERSNGFIPNVVNKTSN